MVFCDPNQTLTAHINGIPVRNGQLVQLELDDDDEMEVEFDDGILSIEAKSIALVAVSTDSSGNTEMTITTPTFEVVDDNDSNHDEDDDNEEDDDDHDDEDKGDNDE